MKLWGWNLVAMSKCHRLNVRVVSWGTVAPVLSTDTLEQLGDPSAQVWQPSRGEVAVLSDTQMQWPSLHPGAEVEGGTH